jgi:hypothetical protein
MGRLSRCESARVQGLLFGGIIAVTAVVMALSLPSGAGAKVLSSGQQQRSEDRDEHSGHENGESAQESPAEDPPANAPAGEVTAPGSSDSQPVTAFRFTATRVVGGVATFRLRGIEPRSIRSAYVKRGKKKHRLSLGKVRAAARRGAPQQAGNVLAAEENDRGGRGHPAATATATPDDHAATCARPGTQHVVARRRLATAERCRG